jgi:hypothetical protein
VGEGRKERKLGNVGKGLMLFNHTERPLGNPRGGQFLFFVKAELGILPKDFCHRKAYAFR